MKAAPRPLPTWLKWLCRLFGALAILGSLYLTVLVVIVLIGTFHVFLGPKGHAVSDNQWLSIFGGLLGRLVGQILMLLFGIWLVRRAGKKGTGEPIAEVASALPAKTEVLAASPVPASTRNRRWHSCNILQMASDASRLWQFDAKGGGFALNREYRVAIDETLPSRSVAKSWSSLWQPRLNVAWLPPENIFLRVVELPRSSFDETFAMVELQLEKLSPLPLAQIVWTIHILSRHGDSPGRRAAGAEAAAAGETKPENLQTVVVVIAERSLVEEHLGKLEGRGYLADRLDYHRCLR